MKLKKRMLKTVDFFKINFGEIHLGPLENESRKIQFAEGGASPLMPLSKKINQTKKE